MNTINALIVEDKKPQMELLVQELKTHCPHVKVIGKKYSCREALDWLEEVEPDLIFLDIELPDGDGFSILQQYQHPNVPVIFVTGHADYWQRAFEMSAIDYLIKPINAPKLVGAVERAMKKRSMIEAAQQLENVDNLVRRPSGKPKFGMKENNSLRFYDLEDEILYLAANGEKTLFRLEDGRTLEQPGLLGDYVKLFAPYQFIMRIHKSSIINIRQIASYNSQTADVYLKGCKTYLKVGDLYKKDFEARLKEIAIFR